MSLDSEEVEMHTVLMRVSLPASCEQRDPLRERPGKSNDLDPWSLAESQCWDTNALVNGFRKILDLMESR